MTEELQGRVEHLTYLSEDGQFAVVRLAVPGYLTPLTAVGPLAGVKPGEEVTLVGQWESHQRFGRQFRALEVRRSLPTTKEGLRKFLSSDAVPGIGPEMAARIVARFGLETLKVIEQEPERLLEVEGIGRYRLEQILKAWRTQDEVRDLMIFLQGHGLGPSQARKIQQKYGATAQRLIRENPYRLAAEIDGVGFRTADQLAASLEVPRDSLFRIKAGLRHIFQELAESGHVCCPVDELLTRTGEMLGLEKSVVQVGLEAGTKSGELVVEDNWAYPASLFAAETGVVQQIVRLLNSPARLGLGSGAADLARAQSKLGLELAPEQVEALSRALREKITLITGGPGTGKTTIIRALVHLITVQGLRVELAAPTGRAARRLAETAGGEAKTIHRLLEFRPHDFSFHRHRGRPLDADMIIVDEASMIDLELMHHLLQAAPDSAHLVLIGDADQLPSVGPGRVFGDLIDSGRIPTTRLKHIFRQAQDSGIILNAHRINQGLMPNLNSSQELSDFYFISQHDPEQVAATVLKLCRERIPARFGLDPINDIQVLSPMHRGEVGVTRLNELLQAALNPAGEGLKSGGHYFKSGDKVMQLRNNYDREVFNGDLGRVISIDPAKLSLRVRFDQRVLEYKVEDLQELAPAYAISIHKSQGSEYPAVIVPILSQHYVMLKRNLIYTAVTRARRLVVLIGSAQALALAVRQNRGEVRYTRLKERLAALKNRPGGRG